LAGFPRAAPVTETPLPDDRSDDGRVRIALVRGAWLDHGPSWLTPEDADGLLATLRAELRWEQRAIVLFGRPIMQPRLIAWAGTIGYRYSGQTLEPRAFTPTLGRLLEGVRDRTGVPFNHMLANRYRDGRDSIGLHADDEPELGDDPVVATVSLGATRRLVLKPRRKADGPGRVLELRHGSLVIMGGACQRHYVHGVPRQPEVREERISLTFRWILREPRPD
jgi:alkylated DNA repair dioxygenase AlkB